MDKRIFSRISGIELLKIIAIFMIVLSHTVDSLRIGYANIFDLHLATVNLQKFILIMFRSFSPLGNTIFFVCSAWFFLDNNRTKKEKIFNMILDIWLVSVIILTTAYMLRHGNIDGMLILISFFPTTFESNWFLTCYILFYAIHGILNNIINSMSQKQLLRTTIFMVLLYVFANYIIMHGVFLASLLIIWVAIYFFMAYLKKYCTGIMSNLKLNCLLAFLGIAAHIGIMVATNFLGLNTKLFSNQLLHWASNSSPFFIITAISLLNIARQMKFKSYMVNYISSLSLLIYIIHENIIVREYYRPAVIRNMFFSLGTEHIVSWIFELAALIFICSLIISILYNATLRKIVGRFSTALYSRIKNIYLSFENFILKRSGNI